MIADRLPAGMRAHASGLIVPEAQSRAREVWTKDEGRLLERATKLLDAKGIKLFLGCTEPRCKVAPITRKRLANGDFVLECEHKTRVFQTKW